MMMRRNYTTSLNAFTLFASLLVSALLLSLPLAQAIFISFVSTFIACALARTFWISGDETSFFENEYGFLLISFSHIFSVAVTCALIHAFDYLCFDISPQKASIAANTATAFINSSYVIEGLIAFWTLAFAALINKGLLYNKMCTSSLLTHQNVVNTLRTTFHDTALKAKAHVDTSEAMMTRYIIPDITTLEDGRAFDLAKLGLFDGQFAFPSFAIKELVQMSSESQEESLKFKAKKALDTIKKLETLPRQAFEIIHVPADEYIFCTEENTSASDKLYQFAQKTHSSLLTVDPSLYPLELDETAFQCVISLESISNALKQHIPKGDFLSIKVQRLGKEPRQGIGYLDDGTMVVVNGGGDYLGRLVRAQVLSQKYSSSGKIIFCNAVAAGEEEIFYSPPSHNSSLPPANLPQAHTSGGRIGASVSSSQQYYSNYESHL